MKSSFVVLAIFVAFASCDEEVSSFIINGQNASIEDFPYMAGVFTRGWFTCGGAILNSRTILTVRMAGFGVYSTDTFPQAAHCIFVTDPADLSISVGSTTRLNGTMYVASRITRHPDYVYIRDPFKMIADIAVVRTRDRIRFGASVQPIPLGQESLSSFSRVTLTGWGQKVNVSSLEAAECH
jgi:secreted trypsin-like serine protease